MSYLDYVPRNTNPFSGLIRLGEDIRTFYREFSRYLIKNLHISFLKFEASKSVFVTVLYRQRGKHVQRFIHSGMAGLTAFGVIIAPIVAEEFPGKGIDPWQTASPSQVLVASTDEFNANTQVSDKMRDKIIEYSVQVGDTVGTIAEKFGISGDTIRWQNDLGTKDAIKVGQKLQILPVTGVSHRVQKGDTVYSIAKKYDTEAQGIVDFPFNTFVNDETFELAIGQTIIVPEGIKPTAAPAARSTTRKITPNAGTVTASGKFIWPTQGTMTQYYSWYHPGVDIANRQLPDILAADAGTVLVAGWPDNYGYGNRVIIDHGNGYKTLYAHMQRFYVVAGQTVARGSAIGQMGSTGRSTGTHLHFEVSLNGTKLNPLSVLQ